MKKYDAIIIGFGKGGKTLAADLGNRGWSVAVIERSSSMYGGTCINIGCIPTKLLVHLSQTAHYHEFTTFEQYANAFHQAIEEKRNITSMLRRKNFENLDTKDTVTVYTGIASFRSLSEIEVRTESETFVLEGEKIFINTGATTVIPPIKGVSDNPFIYTSTSIMELDKLPRHLTIVGGGYIGLEFASIFANFGSKVTVLEDGDKFIPREDRDIAEAVKAVLEKKGISIQLNAIVQEIEHDADKATIIYRNAQNGETTRVEADAVLLATGRRPNTEGLNLEAVGVKLTERGAIEVDDHLHTSVNNIWAIGDVRGGLQFTYLSLDDYRIIRDELFGNDRRNTGDREAIAYSVFIDPPLSHVGMTEEQARHTGRNIKVGKILAASMPRTLTVGQTDGLLKTVIDADTNQILGCTLFCAESSEVINIVSLAMRMNNNYVYLRDNIFTHPSMSESLNDLYSSIK
ncbi:FAD-dependent oxidoreductase [Parabacteroides sp. AM08-6]|uniref:FAD-dependent oxidoreductase n=1 Tax=Parabacteroides sp. AM08-6 TaxID=2292053 RepID=UPI000EFE6A2C|nr:FAD-dependent oxidoreductase [Parabacteroides sp. AM08-6]RHJ81867.1 pyridine nucleotide-disulfide oxidoreductase [Parabacteroides sp. AM08-6]